MEGSPRRYVPRDLGLSQDFALAVAAEPALRNDHICGQIYYDRTVAAEEDHSGDRWQAGKNEGL